MAYRAGSLLRRIWRRWGRGRRPRRLRALLLAAAAHECRQDPSRRHDSIRSFGEEVSAVTTQDVSVSHRLDPTSSLRLELYAGPSRGASARVSPSLSGVQASLRPAHLALARARQWALEPARSEGARASPPAPIRPPQHDVVLDARDRPAWDHASHVAHHKHPDGAPSSVAVRTTPDWLPLNEKGVAPPPAGTRRSSRVVPWAMRITRCSC